MAVLIEGTSLRRRLENARGIVAERNAKRTLTVTASKQPGNLLPVALSLEGAVLAPDT
jgi:hypothetical protein